ncbi:hypothetical protein BKA62DRAFT_76142 [Auriculariales sp. MPI-PUGE-AT-0066]|nr:hypothetical protein BKA62DRAFT_76142 [Auriculariales sp. MPI-PUGE-AT-0066]
MSPRPANPGRSMSYKAVCSGGLSVRSQSAGSSLPPYTRNAFVPVEPNAGDMADFDRARMDKLERTFNWAPMVAGVLSAFDIGFIGLTADKMESDFKRPRGCLWMLGCWTFSMLIAALAIGLSLRGMHNLDTYRALLYPKRCQRDYRRRLKVFILIAERITGPLLFASLVASLIGLSLFLAPISWSLFAAAITVIAILMAIYVLTAFVPWPRRYPEDRDADTDDDEQNKVGKAHYHLGRFDRAVRQDKPLGVEPQDHSRTDSYIDYRRSNLGEPKDQHASFSDSDDSGDDSDQPERGGGRVAAAERRRSQAQMLQAIIIYCGQVCSALVAWLLHRYVILCLKASLLMDCSSVKAIHAGKTCSGHQ